MKYLSDVLLRPSKDVVKVTYGDRVFVATEEDIRHMQVLVKKGDLQLGLFKVYDVDKNGKEYEVVMRQDGIFENTFTCNILTFNSDLTFELL